MLLPLLCKTNKIDKENRDSILKLYTLNSTELNTNLSVIESFKDQPT